MAVFLGISDPSFLECLRDSNSKMTRWKLFHKISNLIQAQKKVEYRMGNKSKNIKSSTAQLLFFPSTLSCSIILIEISQFLVSLLDFPFSSIHRGSFGRVFLCCFHNFPPSHFSAVWAVRRASECICGRDEELEQTGRSKEKRGRKAENWVNLEQQKLENTTQRSVVFYRSILRHFPVVSQHHHAWKKSVETLWILHRLCSSFRAVNGVECHNWIFEAAENASTHSIWAFFIPILQFHHVEFRTYPIEMEEWKIFLFLRMPFLISSQLWNFQAFTRDANASQTSNGNTKKTRRWQNWQHQNGRRHVSQNGGAKRSARKHKIKKSPDNITQLVCYSHSNSEFLCFVWVFSAYSMFFFGQVV